MPPNTKIIRCGEFRDDPILRDKIVSLIEPSYQCIGNLIDREYTYCDTIYLDWNTDETEPIPGGYLLLETVPGCGGNYVQLPKSNNYVPASPIALTLNSTRNDRQGLPLPRR